MVRPYLPRFLREGDKAAIKVVVNNASGKPLRGRSRSRSWTRDRKEPAKEFGLARSATAPFTVKAGGGANLTFPVTAPKRVGTVAFKVVAKAGDMSDGELRPLPVLPGRMHLDAVALRHSEENATGRRCASTTSRRTTTRAS